MGSGDNPGTDVVLHGDPSGSLSRLWAEHGRRHRGLLLVALGATITYPLLAVIPPLLVQRTIDGILLAMGPSALPGLSTELAAMGPEAQLVLVAVLLLAAAAGAGLCSAIATRAWGRFSQAVQHEVRTRAYTAIQSRPIAHVDTDEPGALLSVLNTDIDELDGRIQTIGHRGTEITVRLLGVLVVLLWLHWQLTLIALLVVPGIAAVSVWFYPRMTGAHRRLRADRGRLHATLENNLRGLPTIRAYGRGPSEADRVATASADVFSAKWEVTRLQSLYYPGVGTVNALAVAVLVTVGGYWVLSGPPWPFSMPLSVGTLVAFLLYNEQLRDPIVDAGNVLDAVVGAKASLRRVFGVCDGPTADRNGGDSGRPGTRTTLIARDVTYRYPDATDAAIHEVSLRIEPGEMIGIVGPTGSGKTTLGHLLAGLIAPDAGAVTIGGVPVAGLLPSDRRGRIAVVEQQPHVFTGSIAENVRYGDPSASLDTVRAALEQAQAWEFVADLPDGQETVIGTGGLSLSGGQRQRIAIARAFLSEPALLVLDEATSDLDLGTETAIRQSLQANLPETTVILVSHRLSMVGITDRVCLLEGGRVVAAGSHADLLERGEQYAAFFGTDPTSQSDVPEPGIES